MSEQLGGSVTLDATASEDGVRQVLCAVADALQENWSKYGASLGLPSAPPDFEPAKWPGGGVTRRFGRSEPYRGRGWIDWLVVRFSPLSDSLCDLGLHDKQDRLHVTLDADRSIMDEVEGSRERLRVEEERERVYERVREEERLGPVEPEVEDRYVELTRRCGALRETRSIWPQNRACLLSILDKLESAFPVIESYRDDELREEPGPV